jgi:DNA polymerase
MTPRIGLPALEALHEQYSACTRCPALCASRTQVVFGVGSASARLLLVGTGPGPSEDVSGIPFVGPAGRLLLELLIAAWPPDPELDRIKRTIPRRGDVTDPLLAHVETLHTYLAQYVCWTNVVLCKTPDRAATLTEIKACKDRLYRVVYAVDPDLILALGKTPASVLAGRAIDITRKRGSVLDIALPVPDAPHTLRYAMMPVHDPGTLRQVGDISLLSKRQGKTYETLEDLKYALQLLQELSHARENRARVRY